MTIFAPRLKDLTVFFIVLRFFDRKNGLMAEWLGRGLQNLVQRFESASDLTKTALEISLTLFFFCHTLVIPPYFSLTKRNECGVVCLMMMRSSKA